jgi:hypothetical protein
VIPTTGCQLGASLLTLDLGRQGKPAEYVRGHYLEGDAPESGRNEHWWVEVESVLLDPTRDQFPRGDPFSETYTGRYTPKDRKPTTAMEREVYIMLRLQWRVRSNKAAVRLVIDQYELDLAQLDEPDPADVRQAVLTPRGPT